MGNSPIFLVFLSFIYLFDVSSSRLSLVFGFR